MKLMVKSTKLSVGPMQAFTFRSNAELAWFLQLLQEHKIKPVEQFRQRPGQAHMSGAALRAKFLRSEESRVFRLYEAYMRA